MYETLKLYDEIVTNYYKTIMYIKNKLNSNVLEYSKSKELNNILNMLEKGDNDE